MCCRWIVKGPMGMIRSRLTLGPKFCSFGLGPLEGQPLPVGRSRIEALAFDLLTSPATRALTAATELH